LALPRADPLYRPAAAADSRPATILCIDLTLVCSGPIGKQGLQLKDWMRIRRESGPYSYQDFICGHARDLAHRLRADQASFDETAAR